MNAARLLDSAGPPPARQTADDFEREHDTYVSHPAHFGPELPESLHAPGGSAGQHTCGIRQPLERSS